MIKTRAASQSSFKYLLFFVAIKPFIDLTWNFEVIPGFNLLQIYGAAVFGWAFKTYIQNSKSITSGSKKIIWAFLIFSLLSSGMSYIAGSANFFAVFNTNLRLFDGFLLFFVMSLYIKNVTQLKSFVGTVWISTLAVNLLSVGVYNSNVYNIDVTGGVERFAGIYNDAGGPSYNAVMSLIFVSYFVYLEKKSRNRLSFQKTLLFLLTLIVSGFLLVVTITKSALVMLLIFIVFWWLWVRKSKWMLLFSLLLLLVVPQTEFGGKLEKRFENETRVFVEGDYSDRALSSLATGRYGTWVMILKTYEADYSLKEKLFGRGKHYGAHNQYLAELMRTGAIGLMLFLFVIFKLLVTQYSKYRRTGMKEYLMGFVFLIVFIAQGTVGHPFYYTTHFWYLMILMSIVNVPSFTFVFRTSPRRGAYQSYEPRKNIALS